MKRSRGATITLADERGFSPREYLESLLRARERDARALRVLIDLIPWKKMNESQARDLWGLLVDGMR